MKGRKRGAFVRFEARGSRIRNQGSVTCIRRRCSCFLAIYFRISHHITLYDRPTSSKQKKMYQPLSASQCPHVRGPCRLVPQIFSTDSHQILRQILHAPLSLITFTSLISFHSAVGTRALRTRYPFERTLKVRICVAEGYKNGSPKVDFGSVISCSANEDKARLDRKTL